MSNILKQLIILYIIIYIIFENNKSDYEITEGIDCVSTQFDCPSTRMHIEYGEKGNWPWVKCHRGNETVFGDEAQSTWSADKVLGEFSFGYVTPVKIDYSESIGGMRHYTWSTTMYVADRLGLQPNDGWFYKLAGWFFKSRNVKRAQWVLSGSGTCSCCKE